jgi:enoyl-CoA hydratase
MTYQTVVYEREGPVATIILNRPEKLNAINDVMIREIERAVTEAEEDEEVAYLVFRGAGRAFSVGQDLSGEGTDEVMPQDPRLKLPLTPIFRTEVRLAKRLRTILACSKRTVAFVHGYCLGLACDIMLMCNTVVAADDAIFGDPSIRMGYASANPLWIDRVGLNRAKDLLLTGRYIDCEEAFRIGLVTLVIPADQLEASLASVLDGINRGSSAIAGADAMLAGSVLSAPSSDPWGFSSGLRALSAIQRRGFAAGEFNFFEARDRAGMKGAIEERDAPYLNLFPTPTPSGGDK